jgi:hypothetical protein
LFKDGYWKIADFGLTSEATSHKLITTAARSGKVSYRAPELLINENGRFNNKADIWSFGCIVFEIFSKGKKAFANDFEIYNHGKANNKPDSIVEQLDSNGRSFMRGLLECDPSKRPSARYLLLTKFKFSASPNVEPEILSKERNPSDSASSLAHISLLLRKTIHWSASNDSQPQVFRAFLQGHDYAAFRGKLTFRKVGIRPQEEMRPCLQGRGRSESLVLEKALRSLDDVVLAALLHTVPPLDVFNKERIASCLAVWKKFSHVFRNPDFQPELQEHDHIYAEALKRLQFVTFDDTVLRAITRLNLVSPSDSISQDLGWGIHISPTSTQRRYSIFSSLHLPTLKRVVAMYSDGQGRLGVCLYDDESTDIAVYDGDGKELPRFKFRITGASNMHRLNFDSRRIYCAYFPDCELKSHGKLTFSSLDVSTGSIRRTELPPSAPTWDVQFSPDRRYILTMSRSSALQVFATQTNNPTIQPGQEVMNLQHSVKTLSCLDQNWHSPMTFSSDGNFAAISTETIERHSEVTIIDLRRMSVALRIEFKQSSLTVAFLPGTNSLYGLTSAELQLIWNPRTWASAREFKSGQGLIADQLAFRHGEGVIAASPDGVIRLFKFSVGTRLRCHAIVVHRPWEGWPCFRPSLIMFRVIWFDTDRCGPR